jgi:hypothetical protein
LDTQEFMDTLKTWTDIYRQNREPVLDYPPSVDPEEKKWEENMIRIAAVITAADSLEGTPAEKKIQAAAGFAKSRDMTKLKEIYTLFNEVEDYLKESLV